MMPVPGSRANVLLSFGSGAQVAVVEKGALVASHT
jgi:hypothetical protein